MNKLWDFKSCGIPDELFARGNVPMTKREVRAIILSLLTVRDNGIIWDIGAGTGSISVELCLLLPQSKIYAVERNAEALELIKENSNRFEVSNIVVVEGEAPQVLKGLPQPNAIMIGGGGEVLLDLLFYCANAIKKGGIIVTSCITIETVTETIAFFEKNDFSQIEGVFINVSRLTKMGSRHSFVPQNGIYIIKANKGLI